MSRALALSVAAPPWPSSDAVTRPRPGRGPGEFGAALERDDWSRAYALMSDGYRQRVSLAEFKQQMKAVPPPRWRTQAARCGRTRLSGAAGSSCCSPVSERVGLTREGGGWRLERPPFEPFGQETPRAALGAFIRAIEGQRYDILVGLAPARYRADITPDKLARYWQQQGAERTRALLRDLRLALDGHIVEEGDAALLLYGTGRQARFVREEGLWRIETPRVSHEAVRGPQELPTASPRIRSPMTAAVGRTRHRCPPSRAVPARGARSSRRNPRRCLGKEPDLTPGQRYCKP